MRGTDSTKLLLGPCIFAWLTINMAWRLRDQYFFNNHSPPLQVVLIYRQMKRENCCVLKYAKCIALFLISQSVLIYDLALTRVQSNIKEICQSNIEKKCSYLMESIYYSDLFCPYGSDLAIWLLFLFHRPCIRWFMFWLRCRAFSLR